MLHSIHWIQRVKFISGVFAKAAAFSSVDDKTFWCQSNQVWLQRNRGIEIFLRCHNSDSPFSTIPASDIKRLYFIRRCYLTTFYNFVVNIWDEIGRFFWKIAEIFFRCCKNFGKKKNLNQNFFPRFFPAGDSNFMTRIKSYLFRVRGTKKVGLSSRFQHLPFLWWPS